MAKSSSEREGGYHAGSGRASCLLEGIGGIRLSPVATSSAVCRNAQDLGRNHPGCACLWTSISVFLPTALTGAWMSSSVPTSITCARTLRGSATDASGGCHQTYRCAIRFIRTGEGLAPDLARVGASSSPGIPRIASRAGRAGQGGNASESSSPPHRRATFDISVSE